MPKGIVENQAVGWQLVESHWLRWSSLEVCGLTAKDGLVKEMLDLVLKNLLQDNSGKGRDTGQGIQTTGPWKFLLMPRIWDSGLSLIIFSFIFFPLPYILMLTYQTTGLRTEVKFVV